MAKVTNAFDTYSATADREDSPVRSKGVGRRRISTPVRRADPIFGSSEPRTLHWYGARRGDALSPHSGTCRDCVTLSAKATADAQQAI